MNTQLIPGGARFSPERLRLAREAAGLRKTDLSELVGASAASLSQYETGASKPRSGVVAQLAIALEVRTDFFFRQTPTPGAIEPHFRSLRSTPKWMRDQAHAECVLLWELLRLVDEYVVLPPYDVPEFPTDEDSTPDEVEATALAVRTAWEVPDGPIANMTRLVERHGVVVVGQRLDTAKIDAFSFDAGSHPLVVLGADKGDAARSRLDLGHELGHLVMHHDSEAGNGVLEDQANRFGAAFLAPAEQLAPELPATWDLEAYLALKHRWGMSVAALLYRARELGVMSRDRYRRAVTWMAKQGYRRSEPRPLRSVEEPELLRQALALVHELGLDEPAIAAKLGVAESRLERSLAGVQRPGGARIENS